MRKHSDHLRHPDEGTTVTLDNGVISLPQFDGILSVDKPDAGAERSHKPGGETFRQRRSLRLDLIQHTAHHIGDL